MSELAFSREDIARAERREGFSHPIIDVIEANLPQITQVLQETAGGATSDDLQRRIALGYGPLADAFVETGAYTLQPLEMVAIWSRIAEIFPLSPKFPMATYRYPLGTIISSAHIIQGVENPAWRKMPRHFLENGSLPGEVLQDGEGLTYIWSRLMVLKGNVSQLHSILSNRRSEFNERTSLLFEETYENIGNGCLPMEMNMVRGMQALGLQPSHG